MQASCIGSYIYYCTLKSYTLLLGVITYNEMCYGWGLPVVRLLKQTVCREDKQQLNLCVVQAKWFVVKGVIVAGRSVCNAHICTRGHSQTVDIVTGCRLHMQCVTVQIDLAKVQSLEVSVYPSAYIRVHPKGYNTTLVPFRVYAIPHTLY